MQALYSCMAYNSGVLYKLLCKSEPGISLHSQPLVMQQAATHHGSSRIEIVDKRLVCL